MHIIFLTADWSNFDLLDTAIIPVKIFAFFFWKISWHLFDRCLICRHARRRSSETKMQRSPVLRCHPYHPCQEFTFIQVAGSLSQSSIHGSFTYEKILQWIKNISWFNCFCRQCRTSLQKTMRYVLFDSWIDYDCSQVLSSTNMLPNVIHSK